MHADGSMGAMFRRAEAVPFEPVAVGWGGLLGGAGLVAGAAVSGPLGPAIALAGCLAGGFMTGVRAQGRRLAHGMLTGALALGFYLTFILLARAAGALGVSATAPELVPDGAAWPAIFLAALAAAVLGAAIADRMLRPRRPRHRIGA